MAHRVNECMTLREALNGKRADTQRTSIHPISILRFARVSKGDESHDSTYKNGIRRAVKSQ